MANSGLDVLLDLRDALRHCVPERDWGWFLAPKNLAMALSVTVAEILRPFQCSAEAESAAPSLHVRVRVSEQMADALIYLVLLADKLDVDLAAVAREMTMSHRQKWPMATARGAESSSQNPDASEAGPLGEA